MAADPKAEPRPAKQKPAGPARVVRAADWSAAPALGLAAFSYPPFRSGRAPSAEDGGGAARREAAHAAAEAERAEALRKSFDRGLEQGRGEGEAAARDRYDQSLKALKAGVESALRTLRDDKAGAFAEFEGRAAEVMAFALRRVFGELAGNFPEAVLPLIREAIRSVGGGAALIVKVNPADAAPAGEGRDFWLGIDSGGEDIRCVADERIPAGGCVVVAEATTARADLVSLGERMAEAVTRACEERKRGALTPGSGQHPTPGGEEDVSPSLPLARGGGNDPELRTQGVG